MRVTVDVVGGETRDLEVAEEATYADLLEGVGLSPHEAAVLVEDRPVPEDDRVATERVRVLRLVRGGSSDGTGAVAVRPARPADLPAVMNVLDGAALETDADAVRAAVDRGAVLVAGGEPVAGALVLEGSRVAAVAVRPGRRGRGVGTALVEAAAARRDCLVADFDADLRPFYESLGFAVRPAAEPGRLRGTQG